MRTTISYCCLLLLTGCTSLPNKPFCVTDGYKHAHCAFNISGEDFEVDNSGTHQFTQDGRDWNYDQLAKYSIMTPPDSYKAFKEYFLNECHKHPSKCNYSQAVQQLDTLESLMDFKFENFHD